MSPNRHCVLTVLLAPAAILWSAALLPADVTLPDLPLGSRYQLVFVTAEGTTSTSSDIATYNNFVTQQAISSSSLPSGLTWSAIGSTPTINAIDNAPTYNYVPIYNTAGQLVATGRSDLWDGGILNPIMYDQGA